MIKTTSWFFAITLFVAINFQVANATETLAEKSSATSNDAGRGIKKGVNRVGEALCAEGDLSCAGSKIKNRIIEAKDATVDGVKKIKNKID